MENLDQKTIANAKSSYFLLFVSIFFLFNVENKYINNSFVKNHCKTAFILHIGLLITYIVFISYSLGQSIKILNYPLNNIIATIMFTAIFITMLYWIYKAHNSKTFKVWEIVWITKKLSIIDINWDMKIDEKDKLTIILSYIPLIWYIVSSNYFKNETIKNISKLNLIVALIITLFYTFWNENLATFFSLFYIIFVVFSSLTLIIKNELLWINLSLIPTPEEKYEWFKWLFKYLKIYFKKEKFIELKSLIWKEKIKNNKEEDILEKQLIWEKDIKLPKFLIYIPIINFIFLFFTKSKYKIHIINWVVISVLIIITSMFELFYYRLNALFIFPIFYWIWYLQSRLAYKMPFIFWIYEIVEKIFYWFKSGAKKTYDISKQEKKFEWKTKS